MKKEGNILKHYCENCNGERKHKILKIRVENNRDEEFTASHTYMIMQCCGCDCISFRYEYIDETFFSHDDDDGFIEPDVHCYPEMKKHESNIENILYLPRTIRRIYSETIKALNNECWTLAAAGFRSIIEAICLNKSILGRNLDAKINSLKIKGIITKQDRDRLHSIRFMGNESLHEMRTPKEESLSICLRIIDSILTNLYVIDQISEGILLEPIKDYESFEKILDDNICLKSNGDVVTVKKLVDKHKNLIREDLPEFEKKLIERIESREYDKLRLFDTKGKGCPQEYIINHINTE